MNSPFPYEKVRHHIDRVSEYASDVAESVGNCDADLADEDYENLKQAVKLLSRVVKESRPRW